MTHTAGSASFHKSHKSQGPVMTFTLSGRAVNALPLSAAPESQRKPPADSSLPSPTASSGLPSAKTGQSVASPTCLSTTAHSWSGINAERAVCNSPRTECCQVKCQTWKGIKDLRGTEGDDVAWLEKKKKFCPQECHNVLVTAGSARSARSHRMTPIQRHDKSVFSICQLAFYIYSKQEKMLFLFLFLVIFSCD